MKLINKIKKIIEKRAAKKEAIKRIAEYQKIGVAHIAQYKKEYSQDVISSKI